MAYDPSHELSYGYWICKVCKSQFYGGGPAIHEKECTVREDGYEHCIYVFGPKQVRMVQDCAQKYGDEWMWYGINLEFLKENFPGLL